MSVNVCWRVYSELLRCTVEWFRVMGGKYRVKPWKHEFLYKYSKGVGLDLGCGIAATTKHLLERGLLRRLVLLDVVSESVKVACQDSVKTCCIVGDVLELPFRNACFDTVYALSILHHIPGRECRIAVLKGIREVLVDRGSLVLTVWHPNLKRKLPKTFKSIGEKEYLLVDAVGKRYYYFFTLTELASLVEDVGFKIVEKGYFIQNPAKPELTRNIYLVAQPAKN